MPCERPRRSDSPQVGAAFLEHNRNFRQNRVGRMLHMHHPLGGEFLCLRNGRLLGWTRPPPGPSTGTRRSLRAEAIAAEFRAAAAPDLAMLVVAGRQLR